MFLHDAQYSIILHILPFIFMPGIVMLAAPAYPAAPLWQWVYGSMLGFGETAIALMIALYMAQDSFGTACNVTGDGAIALLVDEPTQN